MSPPANDDSFSFENWATQSRKGLLEFSILKSLTGGERYGYLLVKHLAGIHGLGISEGTIYPLLSRLRKQGLIDSRLVESTEGPARKYYSLTPNGRIQLKLMSDYISNLTDGISKLEIWGGEQ